MGDGETARKKNSVYLLDEEFRSTKNRSISESEISIKDQLEYADDFIRIYYDPGYKTIKNWSKFVIAEYRNNKLIEINLDDILKISIPLDQQIEFMTNPDMIFDDVLFPVVMTPQIMPNLWRISNEIDKEITRDFMLLVDMFFVVYGQVLEPGSNFLIGSKLLPKSRKITSVIKSGKLSKIKDLSKVKSRMPEQLGSDEDSELEFYRGTIDRGISGSLISKPIPKHNVSDLKERFKADKAQLPGPIEHFPFASKKLSAVASDTIYRIVNNREAAYALKTGKIPHASENKFPHKFFGIDSNYPVLFKQRMLDKIEELERQAQIASRKGDKTLAEKYKKEAAKTIERWHIAEDQAVLLEIKLKPGELTHILNHSIDEKLLDQYRGQNVYIYKKERGYTNIAIPKWQLDYFNNYQTESIRAVAWRAPFGQKGLGGTAPQRIPSKNN